MFGIHLLAGIGGQRERLATKNLGDLIVARLLPKFGSKVLERSRNETNVKRGRELSRWRSEKGTVRLH